MSTDASKIRLAAFLGEWLSRSAKRVRPSTYTDYLYMVEHYLLPAVGGLALREATPRAMQTIIDQAPSAYLAAKWRRLLHIALEEAVMLNLLVLNPTARVSAPPRPPSRAAAWTVEQARRFLTHASQGTYHPYWHLALFTGMRPSELLALRWASLDLRAGTLTVSEAAPVVGGKRHVGPPKSAAGKRVIRLEPALVAVLHAHRAAQLERRLLLGDGWQDYDLVCSSDVGTPIQHRNLGRRFHEMCTAAGVPHIRPYDLRHTTASIMIASGADLKAASEVLGHADPAITQRVYQHVTGAMRDRAVTLLSGALNEETGAALAEKAAI